MLIHPEESHKPEKAVGIPAGNESAANETAEIFNREAAAKIQTGVTESADCADYIYKLETNIDDCSGEVLGFVMEKLFEAGARDVHYTPAVSYTHLMLTCHASVDTLATPSQGNLVS